MLTSLIGLRPEKDWAGDAQENFILQTRLLVREGALKLSKIITKGRRENWSRVSDGCLTPRQAGRVTVGRNATLTMTLSVGSPVIVRKTCTREKRDRSLDYYDASYHDSLFSYLAF
jgi:hypothetical protein